MVLPQTAPSALCFVTLLTARSSSRLRVTGGLGSASSIKATARRINGMGRRIIQRLASTAASVRRSISSRVSTSGPPSSNSCGMVPGSVSDLTTLAATSSTHTGWNKDSGPPMMGKMMGVRLDQASERIGKFIFRTPDHRRPEGCPIEPGFGHDLLCAAF